MVTRRAKMDIKDKLIATSVLIRRIKRRNKSYTTEEKNTPSCHLYFQTTLAKNLSSYYVHQICFKIFPQVFSTFPIEIFLVFFWPPKIFLLQKFLTSIGTIMIKQLHLFYPTESSDYQPLKYRDPSYQAI